MAKRVCSGCKREHVTGPPCTRCGRLWCLNCHHDIDLHMAPCGAGLQVTAELVTPPRRHQEEAAEEFLGLIRERLAHGRRQYGDASLALAPGSIVGEIEEELLDVAGWSFVLWLRMRGLRDHLKGFT